MILCDFKFKEWVTSIDTNLSFNKSTNQTIVNSYEVTELVVSEPTILQYVISFWVFTFFCEEIRQVCRPRKIEINTILIQILLSFLWATQ